MHNVDTNLLMQLLQSLETSDVQGAHSHLPHPFNILEKVRPMLPPREQKFIDLMIKFHEMRVLMDEIQNSGG